METILHALRGGYIGNPLAPGGFVMKPRKSSPTFKSFQELKELLEHTPSSFPARLDSDLTDSKEKLSPELEQELYEKAMEGVTPNLQRELC